MPGPALDKAPHVPVRGLGSEPLTVGTTGCIVARPGLRGGGDPAEDWASL